MDRNGTLNDYQIRCLKRAADELARLDKEASRYENVRRTLETHFQTLSRQTARQRLAQLTTACAEEREAAQADGTQTPEKRRF